MATIVGFNEYNKKFDLNIEVFAIKKWLESNWFIPENINLLEFIELIKEISIAVYSDLTDTTCNILFSEKFQGRLKFVESKINDKTLAPKESLTLSLLSLTLGFIKYNNRFFESTIHKVQCGKILQNKLINKNKQFINLLPKNYSSFIEDYESFKNMDNLNKKIELKIFEGTVIQRNLGLELPIRLNICHVAYDDIDQGRKPLEVLCNTLLYHFGSIIMHNNTFDLIQEVSLIDIKSPINFTFKGYVSEYLSSLYPNLIKIVTAEENGLNSDYYISDKEHNQINKNVLQKEKNLKQEYNKLLLSKGL